MGWLYKFLRLVYLAFLDCESSIFNILSVFVGAMAVIAMLILYGSMLYRIDSSAAFLATVILMNLTVGLFVWVVFALQIVLTVIYGNSFLKVAYMYDNKSWHLVNMAEHIDAVIENQQRQDRTIARIKRECADAKLMEEIKLIKEKY